MITLKPEDRPEIEKAVVIAALSAVVAALATWAVEEIKEAVREKRKEKPEG